MARLSALFSLQIILVLFNHNIKNLSVFAKNREPRPIVTLEQGKIQGVIQSTGKKDYVSFKGIPYATQQRFKVRFKILKIKQGL